MTTTQTPTQTRRRPDSVATVATIASAASAYATIENAGIGPLRQAVVTVTALPISCADNGASGTSGSVQLLDFPAGLVNILGCVPNLTYASEVATDANFLSAIGSVAAAADASLTSTEANIVPSTATAIASSAATFAAVNTTASILLDGTSTAADVYLNVASSTNPSAAYGITATGTITITYIVCGDK